MRNIIYSMLLCCIAQLASAQCTPVITPQGSTTFCDGDNVTLAGSQGDTYQWYLNGNAIAGANSDTYLATTAGDYTVEIDSVGCVATSAAVIVIVNTVPAQPDSIIGAATVCTEFPCSFSINPVPGAIDYTWSFPLSWWLQPITSSDTTLNTTAGPSESTSTPVSTIYVTANNNCGSSDPTSLDFDVYMRPHAHLNAWPMSGLAPVQLTGWTTSYGGVYYIPNTTQYQWKRNGVVIPGANNLTYNATISGSYVFVALAGGCPDESGASDVTIIPVSINDVKGVDIEMHIAPNPSGGRFNLSANIPSNERSALLTITDITGKQLITKHIAVQNGTIEEQIELDNNIAPGLYFLKLNASGFNKTVSFVKQ